MGADRYCTLLPMCPTASPACCCCTMATGSTRTDTSMVGLFGASRGLPQTTFLSCCGVAVFKQLAVAGVALHSYDCASFGRSEPSADKDRHLIWDFQALVCALSGLVCLLRQLQHTTCLTCCATQVDDFAAFGKEVRTQHDAGVPMFIGGHSMGALAAIHLALRDQSGWAGLVLVSLVLLRKMSPWQGLSIKAATSLSGPWANTPVLWL